jgi:hypothetical protein
MKQFKILSAAVLSTFIFVSQSASAQVSFGVKGGLGVSMDRTSDPQGSVPAIGFMGGPSAALDVGPIGVMADVLFAVSKSRVGLDSNNFQEVGMKSFLIPVQAKFSLIPLLAITGGAYWSYAVGNVTQRQVIGGQETQNQSISYQNAGYKKSSLGAVGGLEVALPLGVTTLTAEARLRWGFSNLIDSTTTSLKTRAIDILVGCTF